MDEFNKENNTVRVPEQDMAQKVPRISDLLRELKEWKEIGDNRGLYIESLQTLTNKEICVFYYWYYERGYSNWDISHKYCREYWEEPVTDGMIANVKRKIRHKFENIFYGIE